MIFRPSGLRSLFGAKNRIREGCQKCIGFQYQKSMSFLPLGLRSFFGAKNLIREGCQKWGQRCSGSNILKNRQESDCQKRK